MLKFLFLFLTFSLIHVSNGYEYDETRLLFDGIPVRIHFAPLHDGLSTEIWEYLTSVDQVFNDYRSDSEISQLHQKESLNNERISIQLAEAIKKSNYIHALTQGAFNISSRPLRHMWENAAKLNMKPSDNEIIRIRLQCLQQNLILKNRLLSSDKAINLDFGGIIKGIAVDHIMKMLQEKKCSQAMVQLGGETSTFGLSSKNRPFHLAIPNPKQKGDIHSIIQSSPKGISISTSGNSERAVTIAGIQQYHIIDPRNGYPASIKVFSVSILFPEPGKNWLCDSLSTAGVILGPEKTFKIVKELGGEAMFLIADGQKVNFITTPGWKAFEL